MGTLVAGLPPDASVAVIEEGAVGGTCVNVGCTPTKTLVASARVAHMARRAGEYGVTTGEVGVDFRRVMERMDELRHGSRDGLTSMLEAKSNVTLIRGSARFEGARVIRVGELRIEGEFVHINVGARPRVPRIAGLDEVPWLDNAGLLDLRELPEHLVVVGGSYVGLEFGQMFARFGSRRCRGARCQELRRAPRRSGSGPRGGSGSGRGCRRSHRSRAVRRSP